MRKRQIANLIEDREGCERMLDTLFPQNPELATKWWSTPNRAFNMQTPEDVMKNNSHLVFNYLWSHMGGDYS